MNFEVGDLVRIVDDPFHVDYRVVRVRSRSEHVDTLVDVERGEGVGAVAQYVYACGLLLVRCAPDGQLGARTRWLDVALKVLAKKKGIR